MLAQDRRDLIYAHLHALLDGQLGTVNILGRRNADMDVPFMKCFGCLDRKDPYLAMLAMRIGDLTMIQVPYSVRNLYLIARRTTQHLHTMTAFFLGEKRRCGDIWGVKKVHVLWVTGYGL